MWIFFPSPNKECDTSSVGEDTNTTSSTNYSSCLEVTTPSEETPLPSTSVGGQIHETTANSGNLYYNITLPRVSNHVLHERLFSPYLFSVQECCYHFWHGYARSSMRISLSLFYYLMDGYFRENSTNSVVQRPTNKLGWMWIWWNKAPELEIDG